MSFDHKEFQTELQHRLENGLGRPADEAIKIAAIASDVLRVTHGGASHYIPARAIPKEHIRQKHRAGATISALCREYGYCAQTIRKVINK